MISLWGQSKAMDKGQSVIEYILLVGLVTIALVYMGTDIKRGVQSALKVAADQMGGQVNSDQEVSYETSFLANAQTNTWQSQQKTKTERMGVLRTQATEVVQAGTESSTNGAFIPDRE